jgi:unsaturated chondroitin disaccharide hydrolase
MTSPTTQGTIASAADLALDAALKTVRRNIASFGDDYPDDTTTRR